MKGASVVLCFFLLMGVAHAADVSGDWEFTAKILNDVTYARVALKVEGEKISGNLNEIKLEGTIKSDDLTFIGTRPNGQRFGEFKGKVTGDEMKGTASGLPGGDTTWSATRAKKPAAK